MAVSRIGIFLSRTEYDGFLRTILNAGEAIFTGSFALNTFARQGIVPARAYLYTDSTADTVFLDDKQLFGGRGKSVSRTLHELGVLLLFLFGNGLYPVLACLYVLHDFGNLLVFLLVDFYLFIHIE